eukprot:3313967-Prymnesium_polylepis.1
MRSYSESLIVYHVEVRAIRERQRAEEEERRLLAAQPLYIRLWRRISQWHPALSAPPDLAAQPHHVSATATASVPALESLIQTRAPTAAVDESACGQGGCGTQGGGCASTPVREATAGCSSGGSGACSSQG